MRLFQIIFFSCIFFICIQDLRAASFSAYEQRVLKEKKITANDFAVTSYKENYALPFYYTGSPYNQVYLNATPDNERIKNMEIKYQLSFKVPIWKNIFSSLGSLYFAYTQLSYWQAYSKFPFFRETDYEPELFFNYLLKYRLTNLWTFDAFNIGINHQSNGFGNMMERTWERVYLELIFSSNHCLISIKPWYVISDPFYRMFNPDLANYLGYGEVTLAYRYAHQVITLKLHSLVEQGGKRITGVLSYGFPITSYFYGYIQIFSGYGQSLIEYNHRTNSIGLGIALNNLI